MAGATGSDCSISAIGSGTRTARSVPHLRKFSLLSGRVVPATGGNTEFADMRQAYDALDDAMKAEIEDMICEHSLLHSRGSLGFDDDLTEAEKQGFAPVRQSLVRVQPNTGRKSLYLSAHAGKILGMPTPEGRMVLRELNEHATARPFRLRP